MLEEKQIKENNLGPPHFILRTHWVTLMPGMRTRAGNLKTEKEAEQMKGGLEVDWNIQDEQRVWALLYTCHLAHRS